MTRDELIRIAREAGFTQSNPHADLIVRHSNGSWVGIEGPLKRFAELVAAAERDVCAKLAEAEAQRTGDLGRGHEKAGRRVMTSRCYARALQCTQLAADIRALGKKP